MNRIPRRFRAAPLVLAMQAALAQSDADPKLYALTHNVDTVEAGLSLRSRFTAKAEEYSGVTGASPTLIANIDLQGGDAFDAPGTWRWRLRGENLGLRSRSLEGEAGEQGRWRLRLGYDEIQRNTSDSYQTPYQGVGSHELTLPANWQTVVVPRLNATTPNARGLSPDVTNSSAIVGGVLTPPTAAQLSAAAALQAADLPAFRNVDLFTRRSTASAGARFEIDPRWSVSGSLSQEKRQGLKAMGAQSRATNGDTSSILPVPIDENDRRFAAGLSYVGDALQLQAALEGSSFSNHVPSVTWNLWAAPATLATMSTAPSNRWLKLSLAGQWQAAPHTRVSLSASRGRATQDEALLTDSTAPWVPVESAHARVTSDAVNLKLAHEAAKDWRLGAHLRYELRDNRTPVNLFGFYDNNNAATGASPFAALFPTLTGLGQNFNINANTPYSRRVNALGLDADHRLAGGQHLKLALETQQTARWCRDSWIHCADASDSRETTLRGDWLGTVMPEVEARVGLSAARRSVHYDENAFLAVVPMAAQSPASAIGALAGSTAYGTLQALGLTGYGPVSGLQPAAAPGSAQAFYFPNNNVLDNLLYGNENRISELVGMRRFNQADRLRQALRSSATWHASEALTLQAGLDAADEHYDRSRYGLQRLSTQALNLDASYAADEDFSFGAFASHERQRARLAGNTYTANSTAANVGGATTIEGGCFATIALRNANNKIDPCLDWASTQRDNTTTLGARFTLARLAEGRLTLEGGAAWSRARTDIEVIGGNYVNNPFAGGANNPTRSIAAGYVPASALPTVSSDSLQLGLAGTWRLDKDTALRLAYGLRQLHSADWAHEGLQDGGLTQVLPTREQAPHYRVHSLGLSYVATF